MNLKNTYFKNKKTTLISRLFLLLILIAGTSSNAQKREKWKLVWKEEFNYSGLPNAKKWSYEVGHIRNNEKQYFTNARKENAWVSNGVLAITGKKESFPNEFFKKGSGDWKTQDSTAQYTSASINTLGKVGWKYGRIEIKAKLPHGRGIWPAIWMMGTNRLEVGWPKCGEIDIMEFVGNQPKDIYGTMHFPDPNAEGNKSNGNKITSENLKNDFHLYAIEWNEKTIDVYFDNNKYHIFSIDSAGVGEDIPFRKPFYLLLNLAMGANWPGPIDDSILPQQFLVDYVRVYEKK